MNEPDSSIRQLIIPVINFQDAVLKEWVADVKDIYHQNTKESKAPESIKQHKALRIGNRLQLCHNTFSKVY